MNFQTAIAQTLNARRQAAPAPIVRQARAPRLDQRDFGVGYGNSSGYATGKRYVRDWGNARFRFA